MPIKKMVIAKGKKPTVARNKAESAKHKADVNAAAAIVETDSGGDWALSADPLDSSSGKDAGSVSGTRKPRLSPKSSGAGRRKKPAPSKPSPVADPGPPVQSGEFRFLCDTCGKKLLAPETMAGQTIQCPNCKNMITVPQPNPEPLNAKQKKMGVRYKEPKTFKFFCVRCGQSLEADRELANAQFDCPHCKSVIVVPPPADE
jgi:DNA-directed RNA polymerase subunit RPC12/RpoP